MHDECLLELYKNFTSEAKAIFDALTVLHAASIEQLMIEARLTTQQGRRGVWGLACTGLIRYDRRSPLQLTATGRRLVELIKTGNPGGAR